MQFLKPAIVVWACALQDLTCCPEGCVFSANPNRCLNIGTMDSCSHGPIGQGAQPIKCPPPPPDGPPPPPPPHQLYQSPTNPHCTPVPSFPTIADEEDATNQCLSALSADAQVIRCLFEDDADRAEDNRTGLSCALRQAALAQECRTRCENWAQDSNACNDRDTNWQFAFGAISGQQFGSARVDLCGPPLIDIDDFIRRLEKLRGQRQRLSPLLRQ